jgi:hypothetical protein
MVCGRAAAARAGAGIDDFDVRDTFRVVLDDELAAEACQLPEPLTLNPDLKPRNRNPKPQTPNPKSQTLNFTLQTPNP